MHRAIRAGGIAPRHAIIVIAAVLAGCVHVPPVVTESPQQVAAEETDDLCVALIYRMPPERRKLIQDELVRRGAVRLQFVDSLNQFSVDVGMNACEVHAAYGLPDTVKRNENMGGESLELVYHYSDGHLHHRVRLESAAGWTVTSVRDY